MLCPSDPIRKKVSSLIFSLVLSEKIVFASPCIQVPLSSARNPPCARRCTHGPKKNPACPSGRVDEKLRCTERGLTPRGVWRLFPHTNRSVDGFLLNRCRRNFTPRFPAADFLAAVCFTSPSLCCGGGGGRRAERLLLLGCTREPVVVVR